MGVLGGPASYATASFLDDPIEPPIASIDVDTSFYVATAHDDRYVVTWIARAHRARDDLLGSIVSPIARATPPALLSSGAPDRRSARSSSALAPALRSRT